MGLEDRLSFKIKIFLFLFGVGDEGLYLEYMYMYLLGSRMGDYWLFWKLYGIFKGKKIMGKFSVIFRVLLCSLNK